MKKGLVYLITSMMALPMAGWGATISGEVDGGLGGVATSNFVPGATVTLISGAGSQATAVGVTTTDVSGLYSFTNVAVGFFQVVVTADGYTPNPSSTVLAINSDTSNATANFALLTAGSQNVPGTSAIGGQVTNGSSVPVANAQVNLRRRGSTTGAWFMVDSTTTDSLGAYLFSNILAAGNSFDVNAYSLVVNVGTYNSFTSAALTVGNNLTLISNVALTPTALMQALGQTRSLHFSRSNGQLLLDLGSSNSLRSVDIYSLNGSLQKQVRVPAGAAKVSIPMSYAPEKGFVFQIK